MIKLKHLNCRSYIDLGNPLAFALTAKMDYNRKEQVRLKSLLLQLGRRFGPLPEAVTVIRSAEQLDALLLAVLDA
ncbi:MAG: hypothetical protein U1E05_23315 [Patescibacteria group bacterium]|nr:hypothetical protein [Patescibacteria group bacterium]